MNRDGSRFFRADIKKLAYHCFIRAASIREKQIVVFDPLGYKPLCAVCRLVQPDYCGHPDFFEDRDIVFGREGPVAFGVVRARG